MNDVAEPQLRSAAEAILIVADEPVTTASIADALGIEERDDPRSVGDDPADPVLAPSTCHPDHPHDGG